MGFSHGFPSGAPLTLGQGEVHLWHSFPGEVVDDLLISRYIEILSRNERLRYSRFIASEFSIQYLLTRVLIRTVLSQYLDTAPTDWMFGCNAHGKPSIDDSMPLGSDISFNISHTFGLVVVAVGRSMCIGIDAEPVDRLISYEIADRVLTDGEVAAMRKLPLVEQKRRFIELWTLKESWLKAIGMGLSFSPRQIEFIIESKKFNLIRLGLTPADMFFGDWCFSQLLAYDSHLIAICTNQITYPVVSCYRTLPLIYTATAPLDLVRTSQRTA
jgi:4'-phosphopantetheinyl transferase